MSEQAQEMVDVKIPIVMDVDGGWAAFGTSCTSQNEALEVLDAHWEREYGDRFYMIELQLPKPQIQTVKVKSKYRSRKEEAPAPQPEATEKTFAVEVSFAEPPFEALHFNTSPFRAATAEEAKEKAIKAHTEWGKADVKVLSCRPVGPDPQAEKMYLIQVAHTDMSLSSSKVSQVRHKGVDAQDAGRRAKTAMEALGFLNVHVGEVIEADIRDDED